MANYRKQHRSKRSKKKQPEKKTKRPFIDHPKYGKIPLVFQEWLFSNGKTIRYPLYDPDYIPRIPPGTVRGNPRNQNYGLNCPKYFYEDITRDCHQCGKSFTFSADEQKFWYEKLKFYFESTAIRCKSCRRQRRTDKMLRQQVAAVSDVLREKPESPGHLIEYGNALLMLYERTNTGDLDKAIAAARKARRLLRNIPQIQLYLQALYLEGRCQVNLQRPKKAADCLEEFLADVNKFKKGFKKEIQWTNAWREEMSIES